jgi:hypothetical protein
LVAKGSLERGRKIYVDDFLTPGEMQERRVLAPVRRVLKEKYHMVLTWRRSKLVRVRDGWVDKSSKGPKWIPVSSKEIVMGEDGQQGSSQQGGKQLYGMPVDARMMRGGFHSQYGVLSSHPCNSQAGTFVP